ncbi:NADP-dependent oxidoreductase [Rhodococcoides yunnanense]|uniref:NADP-dependent oxidoreductase n=1 Tax=Rhodococcoides yunnanense TaxID=278209 RepID=A0ABU4BK81_9NOCA|nr:NADP-dependent oxidoreductase [Rhodococcus yunnanensis]MDV6264601.1 NADP-dependent oxidoreductase [Rhodococcus yunnanensis]
MRTITFETYGDPSVLHLADADTPTPSPTQVRVAIRRIGINPFDIKLRSGALQQFHTIELPTVPGSEIAGVIDAIGTDVTDLTVGDTVFGWSDTGAYADYALATNVIRTPIAMTWERAASLPVAGEAALRALRMLDVQRGNTLLIHGVAGNVGTIAARIALARGITVVGTARQANHRMLREIGVTPENSGHGWVEAVKAAAPSGITAILDTTGGGFLPESIDLMRGPDRIVTLADPAAYPLGVRFAAGGPDDLTADVLDELSTLSASLVLPDPRIFELDDAAAAHAAIETGGFRGKTLLTTE